MRKREQHHNDYNIKDSCYLHVLVMSPLKYRSQLNYIIWQFLYALIPTFKHSVWLSHTLSISDCESRLFISRTFPELTLRWPAVSSLISPLVHTLNPSDYPQTSLESCQIIHICKLSTQKKKEYEMH
jgi:hypothetical protein